MKQIILGTAGHIDHGKTSLIRALTGIDTDRLKEEKERGITIELGFAHLGLPDGRRLGIVDVPGHEKFVKNMVAGATGIDLVAMVIAADEGVMPQTREHLEICSLLKIKHGLVVLTKVDMVDADWLELVREDVSEYLSDTFLADAPMAEVSSVTKEGIPELIDLISRMTKEIPERDMGHLFRLPIDRVFTMKGFGTVITGTSASGMIRTGDDVTVYPQGISSKIRGIHVHNETVQEVQAGLRTAINLQGIEKMMLQRGNVIATKDALRSTYMLDVVLDLLSSAPRKLKNRAKVRFHAGTAEIISTLVLLDRDELNPGETCLAQLRLDAPTTVLKGDRYVLRSYSPVRTIGGGQILNPLPGKKKRFQERVLSELKLLDKGEEKESIELFVSLGRFQGVGEKELSFLVNMSRKKLTEQLNALKAKRRIIRFDKERGTMIHADFMEKAKGELLKTLSEYHKVFPLKQGLIKEELRSRMKGANDPKLFNHLIHQLEKEEALVQEKEVVRLKYHQVTLAQDQKKTRRELEEIYDKGRLQPPYFKEIKSKFQGNTASEVLGVMVKEGVLVKVKEDLYFHRNAVETLEKDLVDFLRSNGEITTPQFKEMTGASRKYTIPLIEYFDGSQVTVRVGDSRVLRKKQLRHSDLKKSCQGLITALGLGPKEHVAVVGGGGKSTLCFALAEALGLTGARVISSTTTKVRQAEANAFPRLVLYAPGGPDLEAVEKGLDETGSVFVGKEFLLNGKVGGIPPAWADDLFRMPGAAYVIIEADGAAGRPLKAPAAHEPVIPGSVTTVIALMGLKVLGEPLGPDTVFRPALFKALTGLEDGDILNPERLVRAFDQKAGLFRNAPVPARKIVFLNQLDRLTDERPAHHLAQLLLTENPFIERVVLGSCQQNTFITIPRGRV